MKKNKMFMLVVFFILVIMGNFFINLIYASEDGLVWWDKASDWYVNGESTVGISSNLLSGIANMIEIIGTAVIAIVTLVLGIKYMTGTVQGKTEVKENLVNLLVACLFFFGWANIRDLLIVGNATVEGGINGNTTFLTFFRNGDISSAFSQIFTFLLMAAQTVAVFVILYLGVKYIFAGANAKAELKQKSPAMIIGIILIFCTVSVVRFIADIVSSI